jgi:hypothetical protein
MTIQALVTFAKTVTLVTLARRVQNVFAAHPAKSVSHVASAHLTVRTWMCVNLKKSKIRVL